MEADIVFINGEVITVDPKQTIQEGVAVKGNLIIDTGTSDEMKEHIGSKTKVIDLKGRSLLPGFIDAHLHLTIYGTNLLGASCVDPHIQSLKDIFKELRKKVENTGVGEWIRAWGFNEHEVEERRFPTREELDALSMNHPIVIIRTCNHTSIANSKALEMAGFTNQSVNPEGGIVEKDDLGELTGRLMESAHMQLFAEASFSDEELKRAMKLAADAFVNVGITSIHDAGGYGSGPDILRVMQQSSMSGDIKVRVYAMIGSLTDSKTFIRRMVDAGVVTGLGDNRFKIGPAKLFTDGSSTGPTIATRQPYDSDPENKGILYYHQEELDAVLGEAHRNGFQITAHAQGDRAIEMVLNCIERALFEHPRDDHRHRIEHAGVASPDLQKRMKQLNVIAIPNPAFMYMNGELYVENYGERVQVMYPARDYIDASIPCAFASDTPVIQCDPLLGIHAAVNRKTKSGQGVGVRQSIDVLEAVKAYTWMGAYASFEEQSKGSIEIGKLADLVVLNESLLAVEKEEIKDLYVDMTMIDGEILFGKMEMHVN